MLYPNAFASRCPFVHSRSTNISCNWETNIRRIPESSSVRFVIEESMTYSYRSSTKRIDMRVCHVAPQLSYGHLRSCPHRKSEKHRG